MQTQRQICRMLQQAGLRMNRRLGQCFLIDHNLMGKLLDLAEMDGSETVLEVGAGTGSLTEELINRSAKVVAVEIDRGFCGLLQQRFGGEAKVELIHGDVLAGKHVISPVVLKALGPQASIVANLPYNIATPLVAQCLLSSWQTVRLARAGPCRFERLTFTIQREVSQRLAASHACSDYGPISIIISLLGRLRLGPVVPASAFWPQPKVASRIVRIDFDPAAASELVDADTLSGLLMMAFTHRRKQIGSMVQRKNSNFAPEQIELALESAGVDRTDRPQDVEPRKYLAMANALAGDDSRGVLR